MNGPREACSDCDSAVLQELWHTMNFYPSLCPLLVNGSTDTPCSSQTFEIHSKGCLSSICFVQWVTNLLNSKLRCLKAISFFPITTMKQNILYTSHSTPTPRFIVMIHKGEITNVFWVILCTTEQWAWPIVGGEELLGQGRQLDKLMLIKRTLE